jgi:hypothetical protein
MGEWRNVATGFPQGTAEKGVPAVLVEGEVGSLPDVPLNQPGLAPFYGAVEADLVQGVEQRTSLGCGDAEDGAGDAEKTVGQERLLPAEDEGSRP